MVACLKNWIDGRIIAIFLHTGAFLTGALIPIALILFAITTGFNYYQILLIVITIAAYITALVPKSNFEDLKGKYDRRRIKHYLKEVASISRLSCAFLLGQMLFAFSWLAVNFSTNLPQDITYILSFTPICAAALLLGIAIYKFAP